METTKFPSYPNSRLTIAAPAAATVFLAGTFNDWAPDTLAMKKDAQGLWSHTLNLAPGSYEYKFVVDQQWCCEAGSDNEHVSSGKCVHNSFGTMNRVLDVA